MSDAIMKRAKRRLRLRHEFGEMTTGVDYVTWIEGKLLEAEERLDVKCQHPNVEQCASLWQADTNRRQLEDVSPELAEEFPWGCDTVIGLATALVASRKRVKLLRIDARERRSHATGPP